MEGGNELPTYTEASGQPNPAPAPVTAVGAQMDVEAGNVRSPPNYNAPPGDAPPSYASLFGKLQEFRDLKQNSSGNAEFIQQAAEKAKPNTCCMLIWSIFLLALPIAMIVIGAIKKDLCTYERFIPIYLIVSGSFSVAKSIFNMIELVRNRNNTQQDGGQDKKKMPVNPFDGCVNLFLFCWFIAGSYWIYHIHPDVDTVNLLSPKYCDHTLYWFAFWTQTISYIIMAIGVFFCCLGCVCICCCSCFAKKEQH